jgi:hypothetical protein
MGVFMKETVSWERSRDMERRSLPMQTYMKVSGLMISCMGKASMFLILEVFTKDNSAWAKSMDLVNSLNSMEMCMKATGNMTKLQGKVSTSIKTRT